MNHCTSCGKKLEKNKKYCIHCGSKIRNPHKRFLMIFLVSLSFIVLIFLIQTPSLKVVEEIEKQNTPTNIYEENNEFKQPQVRKEGYINEVEKPFETGNYEYEERTPDFRFVCTRPCPVSRNILDQEFAAISYAVSTLRGLTQSDFEEEVLLFEVHASEDFRCPFNQEALAYMTSYIDNNGNSRGLLCFFFEQLPYNRDKFPYSTSVHEVTHLLEEGKIEHNSVIWEGLSEMMESFFLRGNERNSFCWQGNDWYKDIYSNSHDPHGAGRELFFELCNQYGFDYDDLPTLFREIDKRGEVSIREFVSIINNIVGSDTSYLFRKVGVNV